MQVFFQPLTGGPIVKELLDKFTLNDFIMAASEALGYNSREILKLRFAVSNKNLDVKNEKGFDENKHFITKDCNIFVLGRLLGGWTLPDTLQAIAEQQLEDELDKVDTQTADCTICLDSETDCLKVCCAWMCRADFKSWLLDKQFKVSCTLCSKAIMFRDIFKTPEYVATLQALEDEKQLLKNIDCQRCFDCSTLLHNETMHSCQKCITCCREFCFFCNRNWNAETMRNQKYTCGKGCVYETMLYFEPIPFHYNKDMKIPNRRTCPRCFNFGAYDNKCKYHTCTECKFTFCFLCLEEEKECKRKYKSRYDHACVKTPIPQDYCMFPRLISQ